jgi:hypothetical protein
MRASIAAQGFSAEANTYPDGTLTLAILNPHGHTIAVGTWDEPEQETEVEAQEFQWARRASA